MKLHFLDIDDVEFSPELRKLGIIYTTNLFSSSLLSPPGARTPFT
jgi:hypothetical protein